MIYIIATIFLLIFIGFFIASLVTYLKDVNSLTKDEQLKREINIKIFIGLTVSSFIISVALYIYGYSRKRTLKSQEEIKLIETPRTPDQPIIDIERETPEQFRTRPGDSEERRSLLKSSADRLRNMGRRPGDKRPYGLLGNVSSEDYY